MGQYSTRTVLQSLFQVHNWEPLNGKIVADSSHCQKFSVPFKMTKFEGSRFVSKLFPYTISLAVFLVQLVILSRVVVAFTIGKNVHPRLNSIDALSSVAREESGSAGCSCDAGS